MNKIKTTFLHFKKIIKGLFWFFKRPRLIPQIYYIFKNEYFPSKKELTKKEAIEICDKKSVFLKKAYEQLNIKEINFNKKFSKLLKESRQIEKNCPVKMGGEGYIDLIYNLCEKFKVKKTLETGVAYGWSSLAILLSINSRNKSNLISIDMPYLFRNNDSYVGCVIPKFFKKKWSLIRLPDRQALKKSIRQLNTSIDLCHYDSDKSYKGRMWAYPIIWKNLKNKGLLISDDISDNIAFIEFCNKIKKEPIIIKKNKKYVGIIIK